MVGWDVVLVLFVFVTLEVIIVFIDLGNTVVVFVDLAAVVDLVDLEDVVGVMSLEVDATFDLNETVDVVVFVDKLVVVLDKSTSAILTTSFSF